MSITFNDLLTDPKYREMQYHELREFIINNDDVLPSVIYEGRQYLNLSNDKKFIAELFNHLQKLKAESEKKAEPIEKIVNDEVKEGINKMFNYCPFDALFEPIKYNKQPREIAKKPPLGITPKTIHQEMVKKERFGDLQRAITRYLEKGLPINIEWIKEYNELI